MDFAIKTEPGSIGTAGVLTVEGGEDRDCSAQVCYPVAIDSGSSRDV